MLRGFQLYDEVVDLVSAFEALCTLPEDFRSAVSHFERYPRIPRIDGKFDTPDFTVVFVDGTGLVGEIARLALHENSVDKCCEQIGRYAGRTELPGPKGSLIAVSAVDVLLLVPHEIENDAVDRVIKARAMNKKHSYAPPRPPVIAGWSRTPEKYVISRSRDAVNGVPQQPDIARVLEGRYAAKGNFWGPIRVDRPFCNDPVDTLYLAMFLWTKVIPELAPGQPKAVVTVDTALAELRRRYAPVRKAEVRTAFKLLETARFVSRTGKADAYQVRRVTRSVDHPDIARRIATEAMKPRAASAGHTRSRRLLRGREPDPMQDALFSFDAVAEKSLAEDPDE